MSLWGRANRQAARVAGQGDLNAFITFVSEQKPSGLEKGTAKLGNSSLGTLRGASIAIKDNICTSDSLTTCASHALYNFTSPYDATVVGILKEAGAIIPGKTNMDEFGMGSHSTNSYFGPVVQRDGNVNLLSAGGSSGGSAVAVLMDESDAALGTDTGGSVRLPAAYTGLFGFKPSYGFISRYGVTAYANSLDTVGILAKELPIIRRIFDALNQYDDRDPTSVLPRTRLRLQGRRQMQRPFRIGVPKEYNIRELAKPVHTVWQRTLEQLQAKGHTVQAVSLPSTQKALSAYYVLAPAEASSNLAKYDGVRYGLRLKEDIPKDGVLYSRTRAEGFGPEVRRRILLGSYTLSSTAIDNYFIQAQRVRRLIQADFDHVFARANPLHSYSSATKDGVDVLICPTAPTLPPSLDSVRASTPLDSYTNDVFTVPASLAGLPAISVPVQAHADKTSPLGRVGMQIIAQYGDDQEVLDMAEEI